MKKFGILIGLFFCFCQLHGQTEFALLTDLHVSPGNANERALAKIIDEINVSKLPFVIITGDLTNQGSNEELATVKRLFDRFEMPYYVIPGNHETTWSQSAVKEYYRLFGNDRFFFKQENSLFIGYNTGPYMKMGDGHVKFEDLQWVKNTLSKEAAHGEKVYSFAHYPFTEGDLGNWREIVSLLKKHNTIVSFCGHGHQYKEMAFGSLKGIMVRSTFLGSDTVAGYSVIRLTPDSVLVNEKLLGGILHRRFAFADNASSKMAAIPQQKEQPHLPKGIKLSLLYHDNASIFTGVAVDDKAVYFGNSLGDIKAIRIHKSKLLWTISTGFSLYSTPVCSDHKVIVPATNGTIYALSASDGKKVWQLTDGNPFVADGLVKAGKLYQGGYKKFYKIDIASGSVEWVFPNLNNYCQARPAVADGKVVFGAWDTNLYCLNDWTGALEWKWNNGKNQNLYSPANSVPVISGEKVVIVAPDRFMTALNLTTGKQLWRSNQYQVRESQGVSQDGKTIYAKLMDGKLLAVSAQNSEFQPLWTVDAGLGYEHAPCPLLEKDGVVYLGSRNGVIVAIDALNRKVLWSYKCGNSEINQFSVNTDGSIYFSLIEGKIYKLVIE